MLHLTENLTLKFIETKTPFGPDVPNKGLNMNNFATNGGIPIDRRSDRPIIEKGPIERGSDRPIIEKGPLDRGSNRPIIEKGPIDRGSDRPIIEKGPIDRGSYRPNVR